MVTIGRLQEEDIPQAITCIHQGSIANKRDYPDKFIDLLNTRHYTEDWLTRKLKEQPYFVARLDDTIVGIASYCNSEIVNVFVDLNYQSRGIGKQLMVKVEEEMRTKGIQEIHLTANLTSKAFYEKLGYDLIDTKIEKVEEFEIIAFNMLKNL